MELVSIKFLSPFTLSIVYCPFDIWIQLNDEHNSLNSVAYCFISHLQSVKNQYTYMNVYCHVNGKTHFKLHKGNQDLYETHVQRAPTMLEREIDRKKMRCAPAKTYISASSLHELAFIGAPQRIRPIFFSFSLFLVIEISFYFNKEYHRTSSKLLIKECFLIQVNSGKKMQNKST